MAKYSRKTREQAYRRSNGASKNLWEEDGTEHRRTANRPNKGETSQISRQEPERRTNKHQRRRRERKIAPLISRKNTARENQERRTNPCCGCGCGCGRQQDWGIRVPRHVRCWRGLRRAGRRHVPSNRNDLRGATHRIGVLRSSFRSWFHNRARTPSPATSASRSTDQPSGLTRPRTDRTERRCLRNLTARTEERGDGESTAMAEGSRA